MYVWIFSMSSPFHGSVLKDLEGYNLSIVIDPSTSFSSLPWIEKEIRGLNCARRACYVCEYGIKYALSCYFFLDWKQVIACMSVVNELLYVCMSYVAGIKCLPCEYDNGSSMYRRVRIQSPHCDRIPPCSSLRCHWPTKKESFIHSYTLLGNSHTSIRLYWVVS